MSNDNIKASSLAPARSVLARGMTERSIRRLVTAGTLCGAMVVLFSLSACNTTEGVGKDVKSLGEGVEDAAQDAND